VAVILPFASCEIVAIKEVAVPLAEGLDTAVYLIL
jgi:hypothetical protein